MADAAADDMNWLFLFRANYIFPSWALYSKLIPTYSLSNNRQIWIRFGVNLAFPSLHQSSFRSDVGPMILSGWWYLIYFAFRKLQRQNECTSDDNLMQ